MVNLEIHVYYCFTNMNYLNTWNILKSYKIIIAWLAFIMVNLMIYITQCFWIGWNHQMLWQVHLPTKTPDFFPREGEFPTTGKVREFSERSTKSACFIGDMHKYMVLTKKFNDPVILRLSPMESDDVPSLPPQLFSTTLETWAMIKQQGPIWVGENPYM